MIGFASMSRHTVKTRKISGHGKTCALILTMQKVNLTARRTAWTEKQAVRVVGTTIYTSIFATCARMLKSGRPYMRQSITGSGTPSKWHYIRKRAKPLPVHNNKHFTKYGGFIMNRQQRRKTRSAAMRTTIRQVQADWRYLVGAKTYDHQLGDKLYAQQVYMARQIAEANYTEDAAAQDAKELANAIADVDDYYARSVIKEMARSRRYWHIACYEEMWSL